MTGHRDSGMKKIGKRIRKIKQKEDQKDKTRKKFIKMNS